MELENEQNSNEHQILLGNDAGNLRKELDQGILGCLLISCASLIIPTKMLTTASLPQRCRSLPVLVGYAPLSMQSRLGRGTVSPVLTMGHIDLPLGD